MTKHLMYLALWDSFFVFRVLKESRLMLISVFLTGILATCAVDPALTQSSVDRTYETGPQDCRAVNWAEVISRKCSARGAASQRGDGIFSVTLHGDRLLAPRVDTLLNIDGRETAISPVRLGTPLSLGVPEDRLAVRFFVSTAAAESLKIPIVKERIVARAPVQTGRADDEPQSIVPRTLPGMDSALSSLAWCAAISILLAAAAVLSRWLSR
jgi:hypothetical protein